MLAPNPAAGAVELVYFKGAFLEAPTSVQLEWKTAYESRTAGYFIKRKISGSDDPAVVISVKLEHDASSGSTNFVQAAEDGVTGADYAVYDFSIVQGENYEYSLWEQEFNNSEPSEPEKLLEIEASPLKVSTELGSSETPQATPTATATSSDSTTDGNTVTPDATSSPAATFPPTSTPNLTISPTITAAATDAQNDDDSAAQATPTVAIVATSPVPVPVDTAPGSGESETEEGSSLPPTAAPTAQTNSGSGVAEASELPQDDEYPEPSPDAANQQDDVYVPPAATSTPLPINDQDVLPIAEGVDRDESQTGFSGQAVDQATQEEISRNRLILWGGFLGSLLFFIAVVIGTILMYRQRNTRG
ncbi:MAG: hypothetical protein AB8G95_20490 [Anaerolineae bacterium]